MFSLTDAFTLGISRIRMAGHQWSSTAVLGPLGPAGIDARPGQETGDWRLETGDWRLLYSELTCEDIVLSSLHKHGNCYRMSVVSCRH